MSIDKTGAMVQSSFAYMAISAWPLCPTAPTACPALACPTLVSPARASTFSTSLPRLHWQRLYNAVFLLTLKGLRQCRHLFPVTTV